MTYFTFDKHRIITFLMDISAHITVTGELFIGYNSYGKLFQSINGISRAGDFYRIQFLKSFNSSYSYIEIRE